MHPLAAAAISLLLVSPWAPGAVERHLLGGRTELHLPLQELAAAAKGLRPILHDRDDWAPAFLVAGNPAGLALDRGRYVSGIRLRPLEELPLDSAEYLYHALASRAIEGLDDRARRPMRARAITLFESLPPEARWHAYVDAGASFGSHALAVAHEVERKRLQWEAEGRDLCRALRVEAPIFVLWRAVFEQERYPGRWETADGSTRSTLVVLARVDKELVVRSLLEGRWVGDPLVDFAHLCGS